MFGLSIVKIIFDDGVDDLRQEPGQQPVEDIKFSGMMLLPEVQPPYGPTGKSSVIHSESPKRDSERAAFTLQTWVMWTSALRGVPGVAGILMYSGEG